MRRLWPILPLPPRTDFRQRYSALTLPVPYPKASVATSRFRAVTEPAPRLEALPPQAAPERRGVFQPRAAITDQARQAVARGRPHTRAADPLNYHRLAGAPAPHSPYAPAVQSGERRGNAGPIQDRSG
jgi:hypothetical protein